MEEEEEDVREDQDQEAEERCLGDIKKIVLWVITSSSPLPTFLPKSSSSSRLISCSNPSCLWIHPPRLLSRCRMRNSSSHAARPQLCPPYLLLYATGSTAGLLLADTLALPSRSLPGFVLGCSLFSDRQPPTGLAAFGRGAPSFPAQLGLNRFSYCLLSRRFDDDADVSGSLILGGGGGGGGDGDEGLSFVPFLRGAPSFPPFPAYYYVGLRRITVGGRRVRLPRRALVPDTAGSGGAIVDSGTTFTYLNPAAFAPLAAALLDRVAGRLNRSAAAERRTGLRPCFTLPQSPPRAPTAAAAELGLPELALHFNGGVDMRLPVENCFVLAGPATAAAEAVCLAVVSGDDGGGAGPWIILGSFQQQNYYMVYDLEKDRLGFRPQSCSGA
ncbi:probable aspartyl protease At4g16563 [Ananas comosus]|uniref:Probable aspartyl protease At4g16563 n=1 Tax=Ananas comosus TaxID=4615 RepID=A0A6P5EJV3_ANACO|nr:probable aspartyl protease At4g16563 [Ananas comosus]